MNVRPPTVVLTSVLKFNKPVRFPSPTDQVRKLELGPRDQVVTFEFAALDYAAPEKNHYSYRLEGFDPDWIELGPIRRVTYTNLDPGSYVLRVRAANNDGVWSEGLTLPVRVIPPFWRTWWAYLVYLLAAAAAAAAVVHSQRLKGKRAAQTRNRLEEEVQTRTRELAERNQQLEVANQRLEEASVTDALTGLRNRRFLFQEVIKDLALAERTRMAEERSGQRGRGERLLFIMVDLDWFKPINDACGHAAGDRVLVQVRDILQHACRASDVLIRWGGDEFLVVGRSTDPEGLEVLPERIRSMVEQAVFDLGNGQVAHLTCSIGFTCYPFRNAEVHQITPEQVVGLADEALYVAKKGRNAWVGLLDTERTSAEDVREVTRVDPERLVQEGKLEMRVSDPGFAAAPPRPASRVDGGTT
jgi:diguanylate cyclase (GGDEF)-like protein